MGGIKRQGDPNSQILVLALWLLMLCISHAHPQSINDN